MAQGKERYLYFATPFDEPFPLLLATDMADGDREGALRKLARADSTETVQPPLVSDFATEHYGTGLRSLNHVEKDGEIGLNIWYGIRDERQGVDVMAIVSGEPERLLAAKCRGSRSMSSW
ncbi:hypothetical protein [Streptomyces sp. NBC_01304]|uniref:hypothetical protein n=1 Tax=Streptomyces sp. NBC_01304 TaxID=2903818 RepID=UPI002E15E9A8|nr:hypothetical protein OG430_47290 [Streptomyces sp. NBC_01304]